MSVFATSADGPCSLKGISCLSKQVNSSRISANFSKYPIKMVFSYFSFL